MKILRILLGICALPTLVIGIWTLATPLPKAATQDGPRASVMVAFTWLDSSLPLKAFDTHFDDEQRASAEAEIAAWESQGSNTQSSEFRSLLSDVDLDLYTLENLRTGILLLCLGIAALGFICAFWLLKKPSRLQALVSGGLLILYPTLIWMMYGFDRLSGEMTLAVVAFATAALGLLVLIVGLRKPKAA